MIDVIPIAKTTVDWSRYLPAVRLLLGRSATDRLDSKGIPVGNLATFIASLAEVEQANSMPEESEYLLRHVSYSILACDIKSIIIDLVRYSHLEVAGCDRCWIVSGNLQQWRDAVVAGSRDDMPLDLRIFCNKCQFLLEQEGLGSIWSKYARVRLKDQTFALLEYK